MELEQIVEKFLKNPKQLGNGAKYLSDLWKCDIEKVYLARKIVRARPKVVVKEPKKNIGKILIVDIETAPMRAFVWSRWKQNIGLNQTISESFLISWSAKWLYDTETMSDVLTPREAILEDDKRICSSIHELLNEADVVIAHNGQSFDIPKMNSRFIINGLPPTLPYTQIDTLLVARKRFSFSSNKLDALAGYFGIDCKIDTNFELWKGCLDGDIESLKYMETYNKKDVEILEETYIRLKPWILNHPNVSLYNDLQEKQCTSCGSIHVEEIDKLYYTSVGAYRMYRCKCGAISRGRKTILPKSKNINTLTSIGK
jgi:hypothetical protein